MTDLIATLSAAGSDNWEICKREGLWGTSASNNHAKYAVRLAEAGDRLFVWQSGLGLIAQARLAGVPFEFQATSEVPWPDPDGYQYGIPIDDVVELAQPVTDPFDDYVSVQFGVQTHQLQSGFAVLKPEQALALSEAFESSPVAPPEVQAHAEAETAGVARPPQQVMAAVYLREASSVADALLSLYRQNRTAAETGELLVIGPDSMRAAFDEERGKPPFDELEGRVNFLTPDELEARVRSTHK